MDALNKFYPKVQPMLMSFFRENNQLLPEKIQNSIQELFNEVLMRVADIYRKEILRDKFDLNIDLTKYPQWDENPGQSFIQRFNPCEVCGQVRVLHQCHIIPRNHGGADKADNYVTLCANHHHLFDRHKLSREEWDRIDWSSKSEESRIYVNKVRLPRQEMFWKHFTAVIAGCKCGNSDFTIEYKVDAGDGKYIPESLNKSLICKACGLEYSDSNFYGDEFQWWWGYVKNKYAIECDPTRSCKEKHGGRVRVEGLSR